MGSATSFSHGARGPHPRARARGDFAPRAGRRRSACTDERDDFVGTEARAGSQGHGFRLARLYPESKAELLPQLARNDWSERRRWVRQRPSSHDHGAPRRVERPSCPESARCYSTGGWNRESLVGCHRCLGPASDRQYVGVLVDLPPNHLGPRQPGSQGQNRYSEIPSWPNSYDAFRRSRCMA